MKVNAELRNIEADSASETLKLGHLRARVAFIQRSFQVVTVEANKG